MTELLARRRADADLRLSTQPLAGSTGRQLARQRAEAVAVEDVRTTINHVRARNLAMVGQTAITLTAAVSAGAEAAAASAPEVRHRTDAIADMVAAGMLNIVAEQAR